MKSCPATATFRPLPRPTSVKRRKPCPHVSWWHQLPAPTTGVHWHIEERWSSRWAPHDESDVELLASTETVAWRVLTGRAGQLMCDNWSLDTTQSGFDEVVLTRHGRHVHIHTWRCERPDCAGAAR